MSLIWMNCFGLYAALKIDIGDDIKVIHPKGNRSLTPRCVAFLKSAKVRRAPMVSVRNYFAPRSVLRRVPQKEQRPHAPETGLITSRTPFQSGRLSFGLCRRVFRLGLRPLGWGCS